ncbi:MAG: methyltransferase domain-containing protein [Pseudomonadales bacterium]
MVAVSKSQNAKRRERVIADHFDISQCRILEIGVADDPTFFKSEADVYYMDWFSYEELYKKLVVTRPKKAANLVEVDFVIKDSEFTKSFDEPFDLIIANHVIEHIPDLIRWMEQVKVLLKPEGLLFLSVPHKEYTFDKIRRVTTLVDVLECYDRELSAPTLHQVFEHIYQWRPIVAKDIWENHYEHLLSKARFPIEEAMRRAVQATTTQPYVDVHCHVFTTESWDKLFIELKQLQRAPFGNAITVDIHQNCNEFYPLMSN